MLAHHDWFHLRTARAYVHCAFAAESPESHLWAEMCWAGRSQSQVAGTRNGITAVQLDVKHPGVPLEARLTSLCRNIGALR